MGELLWLSFYGTLAYALCVVINCGRWVGYRLAGHRPAPELKLPRSIHVAGGIGAGIGAGIVVTFPALVMVAMATGNLELKA